MKKIVFVLLAFAVGIFALSYAPVQISAQTNKTDKIKRVKNKIPNRYIVVLEEWAAGETGKNSKAEAVASRLGRDYGGRIDKVFKHALNGFSVEMNENQAQRLSEDSRVKYVEEDGEVYASARQTGAPWGLDRIDQRDRPLDGNYDYRATGIGVNAYIIDTGIRRTHADFGGRAFAGYDAFGDGQNTNDCNGHGTHVAGTVGGSTYGVAKSVRLYAVRVLDCSGFGTFSSVIAGVDWVKDNHVKPAVANMSLGGGGSDTLDAAVDNAIAAGITFAVAAGNSNDYACNYSPARVGNAITVGATTSSDARADYSNYGTCLDIFAPGSDIMSAWNTSDTAVETISGTSMASPHVAGVAALYLQRNRTASPAAVRDQIVNNSTTDRLTNIGPGSPNRLLYSLFIAPPAQFDYDGDGKADISVFRPSTKQWFINGSSGVFNTINFGEPSDIITPADYDGDGKTDIAVYRPSNGSWYVLASNGGFTITQFGTDGDIPVPADYDGDGKADIAVYRPSNTSWYVLTPSGGFSFIQFGASGDKPVPADYDGDGKADIAVYRPSNGSWYMLASNGGFTITQFGVSSDIPVPADYNGDGKGDIAVYRPSNGSWYMRESNGGFTSIQFGVSSDLPVPADYDGDGKDDIAVFRPSEGGWYRLMPNVGFTFTQFGQSGDKPTPNAFIR